MGKSLLSFFDSRCIVMLDLGETLSSYKPPSKRRTRTMLWIFIKVPLTCDMTSDVTKIDKLCDKR